MDNGNTFNHQAFQDGIFGSTLSKRELMVLREIEKHRIREEIITSGLLRRRELEAEVIREMVMEGQIVAANDNTGLSLKDSLFLPELPEYVLGERQTGLGRQQQPVENYGRTSVLDSSTLDLDVSGMKRKSEATITKSVEDTPSLSLTKKLRREWVCSLCQVTGPCENTLKLHLEGMKHRAMEKAKTTEPVNKNADNTDASTEEADCSNEVGMNQAKPFPSPSLSIKMLEWRCDICQFNATSEPHLKGHLQGRKHKAKERAAAETTEPVNKNANNTDASTEEADCSNEVGMDQAKPCPSVSSSLKMLEWRCDICQFNATSEPDLKSHLQGRKHKAKERAAAETTEPVNKNADNSEALAEEATYSNQLGTNLL